MHHVINLKIFKEKITILCKWNTGVFKTERQFQSFPGKIDASGVAYLHAYLKASGSKVMDIFYLFPGIDFNI